MMRRKVERKREGSEKEREKRKRRGERTEKERGRESDIQRDRGETISKKIYVGINKLPKVGSFSMLGRLSIVTDDEGKERKKERRKRMRMGKIGWCWNSR